MSIGNLRGFATLNPQNPDAYATCQRCGQLYNHSDLEWQFAYAGFSLINLNLLVCRRKCLDFANPTLQTIIIPPDPLPIKDPRPPYWTSQSAQGNLGDSVNASLGIIFTETGEPILVEDGQYLEID